MQEYALGAFLTRWYPTTRHDLAASESETWHVPDLLSLAQPDDTRRWRDLHLGYTDPRGLHWLRERIAQGYDHIDADHIIGFAGAQEALGLTLRALLGRDDHAIIVLPAYQPSEVALTALCETTGVALDATQGWSLDLERIEDAIRPNTSVILINFPNNPTGKLICRAALDDLVSICRRHGIWLVNDEVYRLIDRNPAHRLPCVADIYERGVSIDALSKSMGLPGLRVGWMACRDANLIAETTKLKQIASLCLAAPSEVLAHIALGNAETLLARNRAIATRNLIELECLLSDHEAQFDWVRPDGGVVGYVRYRGPGSVEDFATRLAHEAGVLVLPASVWRSSLAALPDDRFRVGFGRQNCPAALDAWRAAMQTPQARSAA